MIDMLNRAADILRSEGWEQEAAVVSKAADEIERLRAALREIEDCDLDPRLSRQSCVEQLQSKARKALEGKDGN